MSPAGFHQGRGPWRTRVWTCRGCGREPTRCWHCYAFLCLSCTTEDATRCYHCRRPLRGVTGRSVVTAMTRHAWGLKYGPGLFGDHGRRNERRARKRIDRKET